ncbi:MAG: 16S rRNA (uracil(1498)-N(3))-methyltransferase [Planctomycetota bacterium]|nr:16S rRNA (uracil(1498)-N(3))-methyltransferase [Planctomycetota bacterium]
MSERFFLWESLEAGRSLLSKEESHHFLRVMRGRPGDDLIVFDGTGWEAAASAVEVTAGRVRIEIREKREVSREAPRKLDLGVAIPKGPRMGSMLRSLTELGVRRVFPLRTARGSVRPRPGIEERWQRFVVEASKQCGRNLLLEVEETRTLQELLPSLGEYSLRLLAHPEGEQTLADHLSSSAALSPAIALIGPEGGFTSAESGAAIAAGFLPLRLAPSILRLETAACAAATAILIARDTG